MRTLIGAKDVAFYCFESMFYCYLMMIIISIASYLKDGDGCWVGQSSYGHCYRERKTSSRADKSRVKSMEVWDLIAPFNNRIKI